MFDEFKRAGVDLVELARRLQEEGAAAFVASWNDLLGVIASKSASLGQPRQHAASCGVPSHRKEMHR